MSGLACVPTGREFVEQVLPIAENAVDEHGGEKWVGKWLTAICCHETGFGEKVPGGRFPPATSWNVCGYHWAADKGWGFVEATEGGTGRQQWYRRFEDLGACLWSLYWLVRKSGHGGYVRGRTEYGDWKRLIDEERERGSAWAEDFGALAREKWVRAFSGQYCPGHAGHGASVLSIMRGIRG